MRVLIINEVCGMGSTGKIVSAIADDYERRGETVRIAYGRLASVPEKDRHRAVRIGHSLGVYAHALFTRLTDRHGFYSRHATRRFLHWAEGYDPDLLWMHNLHGYYINIQMLFEWLKMRPGMKVYWTLHDCWSFTGHCAGFSFVGCDRWQEHCRDCPQSRTYPASYVDRSFDNFERKRQLFTGAPNLTLITPSRWLAGLVKQSFLKEYPVEVRYNEIDREIFRPTPIREEFMTRYHLQGKRIVLGVANVWEKRKGLQDFVRLSSLLDRERYAIVLVGVTAKQKRQIPQEIVAIGRTANQNELAAIYSAASVFFNPTYEDNYPTVNLEAEACGTPVITYDTGGSSETLHDPRSVVVPQGDLDAVIQRLNALTL